jgi:hypothetical protein
MLEMAFVVGTTTRSEPPVAGHWYSTRHCHRSQSQRLSLRQFSKLLGARRVLNVLLRLFDLLWLWLRISLPRSPTLGVPFQLLQHCSRVPDFPVSPDISFKLFHFTIKTKSRNSHLQSLSSVEIRGKLTMGSEPLHRCSDLDEVRVEFMSMVHSFLPCASPSHKLCVFQNLSLNRIITQMRVIESTKDGEDASLQAHLKVN